MDIDQCKVPLCENWKEVSKDWPICSSCMFNTVRRFKHFLPSQSTETITRHIVENIDELCKSEQDVIDRKGATYDRDEKPSE